MTKNKIFKTLALAISISLIAPFATEAKAGTNASNVNITSEAAIVMDYDTGEIIYEKNADEKMYLASTTKLMTALLFAENKSKTDMLEYTESAKAQPPYTLQSEKMAPAGKSLNVGDTMSADVVMKSLLLYSANDVAYMISDAVSGSNEKFSELMNNKAKELGLTTTHFENPNGLPVNGVDVNYSTAYELALITKAAYENEWVRETTTLPETYVNLPHNTRVLLENRNTELGKNGNIGGKTGVTDKAGTCFAGVYERDGKKYLAVVLKCDRNNDATRFKDIDTMMDYSESATRSVYKTSGTEVGTANLEYKLFGFFGPTKTTTAPIILNSDVELYNNEINNNDTEITLNSSETNAWKAASLDSIDLTVSVHQFKTTVSGKVNISTMSLIKANLFIYIAILALIVIVLVLIVAIIRMINARKRKNRRRYRRY